MRKTHHSGRQKNVADKLDERITVVDSEDNVIGSEKRGIADKENLMYRVSALWVKNSKGENLLARRAYTKSHSPGKWGPAVAGTVKEGETYRQTIINEAYEELGIKLKDVIKGPKTKRDEEGRHRYFAQWFTCIIDKPADEFVTQKEEVAETKWFSDAEIRRGTRDDPTEFLDGVTDGLNLFG